MKTAKALMVKNPITIPSGSELREQLHHFLDHDISSAPVVSPVGETLGVLTELAIVRSYLMQKMTNNDENSKVIHFKELFEEASLVNEDDPVTDVIRALIKSPTHRLFVQNKLQNLTGVISPKDILRFLSGEDKKNSLMRDELNETRLRLEETEEELKDVQAHLDKFEHIYQDAPTMMHSVDPDGKIIMANKKIHEILGYKPGELLGKSIFDLYSKTCHSEATHGLKRIMDQGFHNSTYTTMIAKDGQKRRVDIASSALRDKNGKFIATISASRVIDSDSLLRTLHGVLNKDHIDKEDIEKLLTSDDES